jgi:hypothetical protein
MTTRNQCIGDFGEKALALSGHPVTLGTPMSPKTGIVPFWAVSKSSTFCPLPAP